MFQKIGICGIGNMGYAIGKGIAASGLLGKGGLLLYNIHNEKAIKAANEENQGKKRPIPKYKYPSHVVTAASISYLSKYGIEFSADELETQRIAALDEQRKAKKTIFGSGYLLCSEKAQENERARLLAELNSDTKIWNLSENEIEKIKQLDRGHAELLRIRREEFRRMGQE